MRESASILDRPTEVPRLPGAGNGSHPRSTSMSTTLRYDGAGLVELGIAHFGKHLVHAPSFVV